MDLTPTPLPTPLPVTNNSAWDGPTVAALIVSVLALLVSGGAVVYARRASQNDDARRHEERKPELLSGIKSMNGGSAHLLSLVLQSSEPLTGLVAEILDGRGIAFTASQDGVPPGGPSERAEWPGGLAVGERAAWRIDVPKDRLRGKFRLRVTCHRTDDSWTVLLPMRAPAGPPRSSRASFG